MGLCGDDVGAGYFCRLYAPGSMLQCCLGEQWQWDTHIIRLGLERIGIEQDATPASVAPTQKRDKKDLYNTKTCNMSNHIRRETPL